jgi:hypothetical protein
MSVEIDISKLKNFEYYAKTLLKIQAGEGLIGFDYKKRFVQRKIDELWNQHLDKGLPVLLIILKARRHGVSTYVQARMFHECHTKSHRQGLTIAADEEGASYIHNMAHVYYEFLPSKLRPITKYKSGKRLSFDIPKTMAAKLGDKVKGLKSSMKVVPSNERAGLGTGNHYIHFSEYSNYRDADLVRKAVIPTAFNVPNMFVVIESTANGMSGRGEAFYTEWMRAKAGNSVFMPLFYSWLDHEEYVRPFFSITEREEFNDTFDAEEKFLQERHGATAEQLNWRRHQIKFIGSSISEVRTQSDLDAFHEQYPTTDTEAFIVSGNPIFDRRKLRDLRGGIKEYIWRGDIEGDRIVSDIIGPIKVWQWRLDGCEYVISVDAASGEPGTTDFCCVEVFKVRDVTKHGIIAEQVAELHEKAEPQIIARKAVRLAKAYGNAVIAPEIFGYGDAVLNEIKRLEYWNILKRPTIASVDNASPTKLGWRTDNASKPIMVSFGRRCVLDDYVIIRSEALLDEMMIFVRDEGGTASAYGTGKDDRVMAFLISLMAIRMQFYMDNIWESPMGVQDPPADSPDRKQSPLHYDDFWDKGRNDGKRKSWLDY